MEAEFPWQSPYMSMDGNPVNLTDVAGLAASNGGNRPKPKTGGKSEATDKSSEKQNTSQYNPGEFNAIPSSTSVELQPKFELLYGLGDKFTPEALKAKYNQSPPEPGSFEEALLILVTFVESMDDAIDDTKGEREKVEQASLFLWGDGDFSTTIGAEAKSTLSDADFKELQDALSVVSTVLTNKTGQGLAAGPREVLDDALTGLNRKYNFTQFRTKDAQTIVKEVQAKVGTLMEVYKTNTTLNPNLSSSPQLNTAENQNGNMESINGNLIWVETDTMRSVMSTPGKTPIYIIERDSDADTILNVTTGVLNYDATQYNQIWDSDATDYFGNKLQR